MRIGSATVIRARMHVRNAFDRAMRSLRLTRPTWDLEETLAAAGVGSDLETNDNPDRFEEGLEAVLTAARRSSNMSRTGRLRLAAICGKKLRDRRKITLAFEQFPELSECTVDRPLIVTGLYRSGTTFLHRLLAMDPRARAPAFWEMIGPAPPTSLTVMEDDRRYQMAGSMISLLNAMIPQLPAIHSFSANAPEECSMLLQTSFRSSHFHLSHELPGYLQWLLASDMVPAYQYYRRQLQLLRWGYHCEWLALKAPEHLLHLDALLEVLPQARVICMHRSPVEALASTCSLLAAMRSAAVDRVIGSKIGEDATALVSAMLERSASARARFDQSRFCDVQYDDLVRDPVTCVTKIYDQFGLPMTEAFRQRLIHHVDKTHSSRSNAHVYSLDQFGLRQSAVESRLGHLSKHT